MVHKCNKIGCSAEFKWPVQLHRHEKKCRHSERQKLILYTKDGVCVCVYTLPPGGFFQMHDVSDIRERFGSAIFCCEFQLGAFCQVPSSQFPNLSYSPPKTKTAARNLLERKENDMCLAFQKDDIFDIGYKTAIRKTVELQKDTKDKEATLI